MPKSIVAYDLLISCPSDVSSSIPGIIQAVDEFNSLFGRQHDIVVRPLHWTKNAYSQMGGRVQDLLNSQIVDDADMAVGIFWTRFGTPSQEYNSGTEEEIERMINNNKQVFLYFLQTPISPSQIDFSQYMKIQEFRSKHKGQGIYFDLENSDQLVHTFYKDLYLYVDSLLRAPAFKESNPHEAREVLWVDDCPENNVYERKTLEYYGINVTLALNTKQALHYMNTQRFSLIISDMARKEGPLEGYTLLNEVRKFNKTIPYIIYSGSRSEDHTREALSRGAQGNTNDPTELVNMVIEHLSV